ncbi:MAG TPA: nitrilase-related carbon-nitrogen hydrolase [Blastocatellia bacterium]|nr:nitrilase-related carbon-nitrogen hydrolase [Blastocatellia bacterium]
MMRIGFYQFAPVLGDVPANRRQIRAALQACDADLVVLPELATSGYLFLTADEVEAVAEPVPGPTTDLLHQLAAERGIHIVIGLPERATDGIYNSAVLVGPEGVMGVYRKAHLFSDEKDWFRPGDVGFPIFEVRGAKVGLLVCFDHLFPEAARTLALAGAEIICHPSNLVLPELGQLTTRVRAIENRVFWILANRIGVEERALTSTSDRPSEGSRPLTRKLTYTGCSQIIAPDGKILHRAPAQEETLAVVTIDPAQATDKFVTPRNHVLADRRPDLYRL